MAQAVSRWPLTAEARVRVRVNPCGICGGQSGTRQVFSEYFGFLCKYIIPLLLHIHLSPSHEVCGCSDQAAHYHDLGPKLVASLLTRHIGWKQKKRERKNFSGKLRDNFNQDNRSKWEGKTSKMQSRVASHYTTTLFIHWTKQLKSK
jgi:hypothetical protein